MVMGEVTSCLYLNIQVGPATGLSKCVSQFIVVGYHISTTLAGECMMAKATKHSPRTRDKPPLDGHLEL